MQGITLLQDAGTSDDSGRASERLTGSSVAPRDPDSSRDRLSDVSTPFHHSFAMLAIEVPVVNCCYKMRHDNSLSQLSTFSVVF